MQSHFIQTLTNLRQRRITKITQLEQLILRELHQLAYGADSLRLQAVAGSN